MNIEERIATVSAFELATIQIQRAAFRRALTAHWLTGIQCDEATRTDVATCYCSVWRSEPMPNVGAAVQAWIGHVMEQVPTHPDLPEA